MKEKFFTISGMLEYLKIYSDGNTKWNSVGSSTFSLLLPLYDTTIVPDIFEENGKRKYFKYNGAIKVHFDNTISFLTLGELLTAQDIRISTLAHGEVYFRRRFCHADQHCIIF